MRLAVKSSQFVGVGDPKTHFFVQLVLLYTIHNIMTILVTFCISTILFRVSCHNLQNRETCSMPPRAQGINTINMELVSYVPCSEQ